MIIIGTITFPESSANEVAECYQTLPAVPDFMTIEGTYINNTPGKDFSAFSIFKFDETYLDDANTYLKLRYESFGKVTGLSFSHEEWLNVQDALSIVESGAYDLRTV